MSGDSSQKKIVIIGGGIIGCTTAYFLTRHPSYNAAHHSITLLEASQIAGGASGKAGGLLAQWAYPANIVPLSFRLHAELAKEHDGQRRWGYRTVSCGQLAAKATPLSARNGHQGSCGGEGRDDSAGGSASDVGSTAKNNGVAKDGLEAVSLQKRSPAALKMLQAAGVPADLDWLDHESVLGYESMAGPDETAQVHPLQFTQSMAALAEEAGARVLTDALVTAIHSDPKGGVTAVSYEDRKQAPGSPRTTITADQVIVAAGPWTQRLILKAPISGLRAHSVTIRPSRPVSAHCLFTSIQLPADFSKGKRGRPHTVAPEIYARPNDEVYACGEGDTLVPLPKTSADVEVADSRCQDVIDQVGSVSDVLRDGEVTARQACYLPVCDDGGGPWIGQTSTPGLFIAAGHSCWGIQNGPATGKLVSELVMGGTVESARLGALDAKNIL